MTIVLPSRPPGAGTRLRHPFLQHDGFLAIAHRGGTEDWPENTMAAFQTAVDLGYRYVETDVCATRDQKVVAFHDDVLDRLTDRTGPISGIDYATLRQARIDGRHGIPLLEDLFGTWPELRVNLDVKSDDVVAPLIETIRRTGTLHRVCAGSFSGKRLAKLRAALGPDLCTSMGPLEVARLRFASWGLPARTSVAACVQVPLRSHGVPIVDARFIAAARDRGLDVHVWTVNDEAEMERLIALGVRGIMTDRPRRLKAVLERRGL